MIVYTIQKCDTLWKIARHYQIGLDAMLAANPHIQDPNYIMVGQQINIPELCYPPTPHQHHGPHNGHTNGKNAPGGMMPRPALPNNSGMNPNAWPAPHSGMTYPGTPRINSNESNTNWTENDISMRPSIYTTHEGETLEQISHSFMVPLSRLLYYNLQYGKNEPLPEGTRIIIPECEDEANYPHHRNNHHHDHYRNPRK